MLELANITPPPILIAAKDNLELLDLAIIVAIVVGIAVVNIIKKAMARAEEKRSKESIDQTDQTGQQTGQQTLQPKSMRPDEGLARTVRRSMGMPDQPQQQPVQAVDDTWLHVAAPVILEPPPEVQEAQVAQPPRKKRKKGAGSLAQTAEAPQTPQEVPIHAATLYDYDSLRKAIVHYEILAPPKALRNKPEMWEL